MAKERLLDFLGRDHGRSTRFLVHSYISEHGNKVEKERLIDFVMSKQNLKTRKSVLYHLGKMLEAKVLRENGLYLSLEDPLTPSPLESWRIIGIPLSTSLLIISFLEQNTVFMIGSFIFTVYSFAICFEELVFYYRRFKKWIV